MAEARTRSKPFFIALLVLLAVIALGESYGLFIQYQNNIYFQQYVSENSARVLVQIVGLIALAVGAAYLAYLASRAGPTSKLGRISRKLSSFTPVFAALIAIILWFTVLSSIVGGSAIAFEVYLVSVLLAISLGMMANDRLTFRMALRNFTRRKTSMAIVIAGLMIGTAMISGSLVTGDTLTELFTKGAYYGYGFADEVVYARNATSPTTYQYFSMNTYSNLAQQLFSSQQAGPYLLAVTPEILDTVSVNDTRNGFIQSPVTLIGTFSNASKSLGDFHSSDGSVISPNMDDNSAILNDRAAKDLNATRGDSISIKHGSLAASLNIVGIAVSDARGSFSGNDNVFVTISRAQQLTGHAGSFNYIAITNTGGLRASIQHSQSVGLAANSTLNSILAPPSGYECKTDPSQAAGPPATLCAYSEKQTAVDSATASAQSASNFFVVLSSFAIIAGVVLIVNIFVMLAEERKSEMGMSRAVGMKRSQLTKLFLFEGSLYAAGSALVGVLVGIGIAYAILYVYGTIIASFFPVNLSQVLASFTFTLGSLFTAFTAGLFITYLTILLTSWRVSKLNIIRAIRNIPEPPRGVRTYTVLLLIGAASIIIGVLLYQASFAAKSAVETLLGPSLVIFGFGLMLTRFVRNRYAFTITGLALLIQWGVPSFSWNNPIIQSYNFGPELYFIGGALMVLGGVLLVMYNTDLAVRVLHLFYRGRKTLTPVFKTALAYPENKRFRTAATVAMFALILFTVSATASVAAEQNAALNDLVRENSGGYDIITQTTVPVSNFASLVNADPNLQGKIAAVIPFNTTGVAVQDLTTGRSFGVPLVGGDPNAATASNFFTTNTFKMQNTTGQYPTARDAWNAVMSNSSNVVWSFAFVNAVGGPPQQIVTPNPGDVLVLTQIRPGSLVQKQVTVVGLLNGVFFDGIVGRSQLLQDSFGVGTGTLAFIKVTDSADPSIVAGILRRDFFSLTTVTIVIPVVVGGFVKIFQSFLGLFEGFLALGLVVGVAGLGIISIRSVTERRQEIGILRALGFKRRMILYAFILENSYISLLGILIGVLLGINLSYAFAVGPNSGIKFVLPWQSILEIVGFSYALAMLTTIGSARRAARIPPAEALRYSE